MATGPKTTLDSDRPVNGQILEEDFARVARASMALENLKLKGMTLEDFNQLFDTLCAQTGVTGEVQARMYRNKMTAGIRDRLLVSGVRTLREMKEYASLFAPMAERDYRLQQASRSLPRKN